MQNLISHTYGNRVPSCARWKGRADYGKLNGYGVPGSHSVCPECENGNRVANSSMVAWRCGGGAAGLLDWSPYAVLGVFILFVFLSTHKKYFETR